MTWPLPDDEVRRFWSHVVKGPGERDCWCWVGAIADDGYGRFWTRTPEGGQKVLRPHRVTFAIATGRPLDRLGVVEHYVCDNPICVRASGDRFDHVSESTQGDNLRRMAARNRGGGTPLRVRPDRPGRAETAARSRALRDALKDGWDTDRIAAALTHQPLLW